MPRPVAPGLIQGALRGLIAGVFLAISVLGVLILVGGRSAPSVMVAVGVPIVTTIMGAADGLEARIGGGWGKLARIASPLVGLALATTVMTRAGDLAGGDALIAAPSRSLLEGLGLALICGAPLALSQLLAGPHERSAPVGRRFLRGLRGAALIAASLGVRALARECNEDLVAAVAILFAAAMLVVGHLIARPLGRSIGRWLEPRSWASRVEASARYAELARSAADLKARAESAPPEERTKHLEKGAEEARAAYDLVELVGLELPRDEATRTLAWFLRALGREEEARKLSA